MPTLEATLELEPVMLQGVDPRPTLLLISPSSEDCNTLQIIVDDLKWQIWPTETCSEGYECLRWASFAAIFCDDVLEDGTWKDMLKQDDAPLIVTSRFADAYLWSEVLNLGGYDVVSKPFSRREVAHVLSTITSHFTPKKYVKAAGTA